MVGHITRNCGRKGNGKGKDERRRQGKQQLRRDSDGRQGNERFRQTRRIHGRIFARTVRLGIPRIVLDVRQGRTQVMRKSMERRLHRRGRGRQPKKAVRNQIRRRWRSRRSVDRPECGGDQGGRGGPRVSHTHRDVEERIQVLGKRRSTW